MNPRLLRNALIYLLIIGSLIFVFANFFRDPYSTSEQPITSVINQAQAGTLERIEVSGNKLKVTPRSGDTFTAQKEEGSSLVEILEAAGVDVGNSGVQIVIKDASGLGGILGILLGFLPVIFIGALLFFMLRQAQGSSSQTMNFGRSRAKMIIGSRPNVSFSDVAGEEEAKQELEEVVEFLRYPEKFAALGARVPRGLLMMGPPGTGKTLLAKAVAGEAAVPFFSISGSEFVEMFVGVGAARVRDLFNQAKRTAPCIIFIDEIDAVGRHRGAGLGGGHDEREQTLNQILVEMDGFDTSTNVIVIAATNRPDILDPALLRPGRFDRRVTLDLPDVVGRQAILVVHAKGKPFDESADLELIAKESPGFSGADLANLLNESAILAARRGKKSISGDELAESVDRLIAGPERKSRVIPHHEKELTAYHEAGHALVAHLSPHADRVQKISIVARGSMGGYTRMLPETDRHLGTKDQFEAHLTVAMGGRVAERLKFGEITTGASNDLEQATNLARQMITRFGMSDKLGPRTLGRREELVFLGKEISEQRDYGNKIAEEIDMEVRALLDTAYNSANTTLQLHKETLDQVAEYLMEHESVEGKELAKLFNASFENSKSQETPNPSTVGMKSPRRRSPRASKSESPSRRSPKGSSGPAPAPAS
jgi:cell division protease FtsH